VIAWEADGQAGLCFDSVLTVASWLPAKGASRQRDADQLVFGIKHGRPVDESDQCLAEPASLDLFLPVVSALESLQLGLTKLADKLAQDIILVATHPEVQYLDEAVQRIGKIVSAIQATKE